MSKDIQDIVAILDGREEIIGEIKASNLDLRDELTRWFAELLDSNDFLDALPGHLPGDQASQARVLIIVSRIEKIVG